MLAQLPENVLDATGELFVERLGADAEAAFSEVVLAADRTPTGVAGQAAVADAALALLQEGVTDFTYRARGFEAAHVSQLGRHPLRRVALVSLETDLVLPLLSIESLESLELTHCPFAHKHLKLLGKLPALCRLDLQGTPALGGGGVAPLEGLALAALNLSRCKMGNEALASLASLSTLEWLAISDNGITDAAPLGKLRGLRWLHVGK